MAETSPNLDLPFLIQAQKHVTHNEALERLDLVVQLVVQAFGAATPPGAPVNGQIWALGAVPSGAWAGQGGKLAARLDGQWMFVEPRSGWRAWSIGDTQLRVFHGGAWQVLPLNQLAGLGIGTNHDTTNRLAVVAPATLLTHEGAGHQLKINKAAASDTASLLFQTAFSGRAEMGLAGNNDFSVKVSADGTNWAQGLKIDRNTGASSLLAGTDIAGHLAFHRGNILGPTSQSAGIPTGALIERGSNANGTFVRFADGLQICIGPDFTGVDVSTTVGSMFRNATPVEWTFPAVFGGGGASIVGNALSQANSQTHWCTCRVTSASLMQISVFAPATTLARTIRPFALGRWF